MEEARPLKRRRGARSCLACRKAKQRCDLPDSAAIQASEQPQPISMCCHRCKMLKQPCIVIDPIKDSQPSARQSKGNSSSSTSRNAKATAGLQDHERQQKTQQFGHEGANERHYMKDRQTSSQARLHPRDHRKDSDPLRRSMALSGSPNSSSHDLQIFDPFAVSAPSDASSSPSVSNSPAPSPAYLQQQLHKRHSSSAPSPSFRNRTTDEARWGNAARSIINGHELPEWASHVSLLFQPLRLLSELCWRLPTFQAANDPSNSSHRSKQTSRQDQQNVSNSHSSVDDFLTDDSIPWRLLEAKMYQMRHFIPAMASVEELRQARSSDFLLIVLLSVTLDDGRLRRKAEKAAADMAMSALLQGASDTGEITALLILGLYSPTLLLSNSPQASLGQNSSTTSGPPLDGLGFFNSAASAANALDLGLAAASLPRSAPPVHSYQSTEEDSQLTSILRETSLWITLGVHAASFVLAGDMRRKPFIECDENMVKSVEAYCCQEEVKRLAAPLRHCLARLLIDVFRLRAWTGALTRCKAQRWHLENAEHCSTELVQERLDDHHDVAQGFRQTEMRILRDRLYALGFHDDKTLEWLDVEIAQIYYLSLAQTQGNLLQSTMHLVVQASSSRDYLQLMMQDRAVMQRFIVAGQAHNKSARKFAALLCSFGERREATKSWSPPPILLSACAVMVAKALAEELASRFNAGHVPVKDLTDSIMEASVVMSRSLAGVLSSYSSTIDFSDLGGGGSGDDDDGGGGGCDVFAASAAVTRRTADAVDEWACTAKGLRFAHVAPSQTAGASSAIASGGTLGYNGIASTVEGLNDGAPAKGPSGQQQQEPSAGGDVAHEGSYNSNSNFTSTMNAQGYLAPPTHYTSSSGNMLAGPSSLLPPSSSPFDSEDDLDRLLREILSTPIDEYLMPQAFR